MPSSKETGSYADHFGRSKSQNIARQFSAISTSSRSNECSLNGVGVVIKCAHNGTNSVGLSYAMLPRLTAVLGAFETASGIYDCYLLSVGVAQQFMRHRKGKLEGKMGMVEKSVFVNKGQKLGQAI